MFSLCLVHSPSSVLAHFPLFLLSYVFVRTWRFVCFIPYHLLPQCFIVLHFISNGLATRVLPVRPPVFPTVRLIAPQHDATGCVPKKKKKT